MEWLQSLLDNSTTPALIAFLLGLLTAVSPCPLATNIAAIGYIGKEVENRKTVFRKGLLYTLGRIVAYTALGCVLIMVLEEGASLFGIQKVIGKYGEMLLPPVLLLIGLFMLFGNTLNLPQFGFKGSREGLAKHGNWGALWLGMLFAMGYIGKEVENRKTVFRKGLLYTLGRIVAYTALGCVLIMVLEEGASLFGIQKVIGKYGEMLLPPVLLLIGLFMLFGNTLNLPQFGFKGSREGLAKHGNWGALWLGMLFAMAFCPTSGIFYFGMLIPMSTTSPAGYLLLVLFAVATALPVLIVAWILAFSVQHISSFYGKVQTVRVWLNFIVGGLFIAIGGYYAITLYL